MCILWIILRCEVSFHFQANSSPLLRKQAIFLKITKIGKSCSPHTFSKREIVHTLHVFPLNQRSNCQIKKSYRCHTFLSMKSYRGLTISIVIDYKIFVIYYRIDKGVQNLRGKKVRTFSLLENVWGCDNFSHFQLHPVFPSKSHPATSFVVRE